MGVIKELDFFVRVFGYVRIENEKGGRFCNSVQNKALCNLWDIL
jgi:hypothetical protein